MTQEKPDKCETSSNSTETSCPNKSDELDKLTSIEQIDDSELPQSVKDKFKD